MIDLRKKGLPDAIEVNGSLFYINTDFREWLKFGELIKADRPYSDYFYLFKTEDDIPLFDFIPYLFDFYCNKNETPNTSGSTGNVKTYDYVLDGAYIVASFMQAYHIDLTTCDMHWHLFKALFESLPDDTIMGKIMTIRGHKKSNKTQEQLLKESQERWKLPDAISDSVDQKIMDEIDAEFYDS